MSQHPASQRPWLTQPPAPPRRILRVALLAIAGTALAHPLIPAQTSSSTPRLLPVSGPAVASDNTLDNAEDDIRQQRYAAAITALRPITQAHPDSWRAHYDLGFALSRVKGATTSLQDNLRESVSELARSLQLNQRNPDAHKALGLSLTMIEREDLAGVEFAEAVRLAPSSAEAHYYLGRHFMHQGQYSNAALELRKATVLEPAYAKAFENLGVTLERMGSVDEAQQCLRRAVELDENSLQHSEWPYLYLGQFYRNHGNPAAALPLTLKAVNLNPHSEEALLQLAMLYRTNRNWLQALDALQKAERLNPTAAATQYLLGRTYKALGDLPKSREAFSNFDRLRKQSEPAPASFTAARPD